VPSKDI